MSIKKLSFMLLSTISLAALLNGCGSSNKEGSPGGVARVADEGVCIHCHSTTIDHVSGTNIVADYFTAAHNPANSEHATGCEGCHGGGSQHNGVGPFPYPNPFTADRCIACHIPAFADGKDLTPLFALAKANNGSGWTANKCAHCHTVNGAGGVHAAQVPATDDCIKCHDVAAPQHGTGGVGSVSDNNNGVRAITSEFAKWSHHVTGVTLNAAHCAACHLEGTVVNGSVVIDQTKHMADDKIHLRNADDDSDFVWNPATPAQADFTGMDNFCMSCHDADGATSTMSRQIQQFINLNGLRAAGKVASPSNPFGDTISNRYDKMQRPAVVNVANQFDTTNNSHHAVKGPRYNTRTRIANASDTRAMTAAQSIAFAANSSATLYGARSTIYDAGNFNALYSPLGTDGTAATGLGDDSTLHCGDCHTVGQWKVGSSDTANGSPTPVAIGAHGSNNEYLLRNTLGTDQRHTQNAFTKTAGVVTYTNPGGAFLVCYNCHSYSKYGSIFLQTGVVGGHVGEYDDQGRCNGIGNTLPFNGYTTGTATDGSQFESRFTSLSDTFPAPYAGEQQPEFGNIFGIQCNNCHNSGVGNGYGGIHGSANNTNATGATVSAIATAAGVTVTGGAYVDGMGNVTKNMRFLPGLGNVMYVPGTLGGITGGASKTVNAKTFTSGGVNKDASWEQKIGAQTGSVGAGCYTLRRPTDAAATPIASDGTNGQGPSVTGAGGPATDILDTWGACDDHNAQQGGGTSMVKKIVRPVTY